MLEMRGSCLGFVLDYAPEMKRAGECEASGQKKHGAPDLEETSLQTLFTWFSARVGLKQQTRGGFYRTQHEETVQPKLMFANNHQSCHIHKTAFNRGRHGYGQKESEERKSPPFTLCDLRYVGK